MSSRAIHAIAVAVLLITSGCLGLGGGGAPSDDAAPTKTSTLTTTTAATATLTTTTTAATATTSTPATTTTVPTTTTTEVAYPAGFNKSGYTDATTALRGHLDILRSTAFTSKTVMQSPTANRTIIIKASPKTNRAYMIMKRKGTILSEFFYINGVQYRVSYSGRRKTYSKQKMKYKRAVVFDGQFEQIHFVALSDSVVTTVSGETAIKYSIVGVSGTTSSFNISGTLTVKENGLFKQYTIRKSQGGQTGITTYKVTNVGSTTVKKPDWLDKAKERTPDQ